MELTRISERYAYGIGETWIVTGGNLESATNGIVVADSKLAWHIPLDNNTQAALLDVLSRIVAIASINDDNARTWGIWLDVQYQRYTVESGRLFASGDLDDALIYAIDHNQRYAYDLDRQLPIEIIQSVIEIGE